MEWRRRRLALLRERLAEAWSISESDRLALEPELKLGLRSNAVLLRRLRADRRALDARDRAGDGTVRRRGVFRRVPPSSAASWSGSTSVARPACRPRPVRERLRRDFGEEPPCCSSTSSCSSSPESAASAAATS